LARARSWQVGARAGSGPRGTLLLLLLLLLRLLLLLLLLLAPGPPVPRMRAAWGAAVHRMPPALPLPPRRPPGEYADGFLQSGLFRYSRHPNWFAEVQ
jgi:hypothetical protein